MSVFEWLVVVGIVSIWMTFCFIVYRMIAFGTGGKPQKRPPHQDFLKSLKEEKK